MEQGGSPRARPAVGAEVIVYGLRKQRQFNGKLCVVEESCSAPKDDGEERRWELRVKMDESLAGTGRDDPLGGRLIRPPASSVFANTEVGRRELLAERAADKLLLRGAFAEVFGGLVDDLALRIARFLTAPERLLVFSGFRGKIFNTVFMHSPQREGWQQPSRMLTPRIDCAAVQLDAHRMMFAGGVDEHPLRGAMQDTAHQYDALTNSWSELPPMPALRHGCGGALLDGIVYVVGGCYVAEGAEPSMLAYDVAAQAWSELPPPSRDKAFAAVGAVAGRIVVAGGEAAQAGESAEERGRRVEAYSPASRTWELCPPMETVRSACGSCEWRGSLVVCGGRGDQGQPLATVEAFDGREWRRLPDMVCARLGPAVAVVEGEMYAVGGVSHSDVGSWGADGGGAPTGAEPFTADVERFNAAAERWEVCTEMRAPVAYHACFAAGLRPLYG